MINIIVIVAMAIFGIALAPAQAGQEWQCVAPDGRKSMAVFYDGGQKAMIHLEGTRSKPTYTVQSSGKDKAGRQQIRLSHGHYGDIMCTKR